MSEGFRVPEGIVKRIEEFFPESEERRKIAYTLMHWAKKPTESEMKKLGEEVGRSVTTVRKVVDKLKEEGLFSKELGSSPLFKYTEGHSLSEGYRGAGVEGREEIERTEGASEPITIEKAPQEDVEEPSQEAKIEGPGVVDMNLPLLSRRVSMLEADMRGISSSMAEGFGEIKDLLAKGREVRVVNPLSVEPPADNPGSHTPGQAPVVEETLEERMDRMEARLEQGPLAPVDPFLDMDRDQILELLRTQPRELMAMVNPDAARQEGRIEAQKVTLRPIILMLTTYSQMLFEKAVHDGYFEGTLSDFVNFSIEQYFIDRGWSLDWTQRQPAAPDSRRFG